MTVLEPKKYLQSRFQRHANILMWKSYLQRQRRWRILAYEAVFAVVLFAMAVFAAKPVFLTPLQAEPEAPLTTADILASLSTKNILGYAPNQHPYASIMNRAAELLKIEIMSGESEDDLNEILYATTGGTPIQQPIIWVIWKHKDGNMWKFSIRSTERARYETRTEVTSHRNPHLRAGFLAVQLAISRAIVEHASNKTPQYEISLVSMPISPLMQEDDVKNALSSILLCLTLAFIPPVLETEALVVHETTNTFKRALRLRNVDYSSMYIGWLFYAYLTALPICLLASMTLILIFRWIHLMFAMIIMLAYVSVMIMMSLIMGMFNNKARIACTWTTLFTLLQMYLAGLLVYHNYESKNAVLSFLMQVLLPPLGLVHALNQFALLQTGRDGHSANSESAMYTVVSWCALNLICYGVLMLLQRTIGQERAIGGQVSWKSIIFKKVEDTSKLRPIQTPTGKERDKLQDVDELVAKAVSFRNVSKSIMGVEVLSNITLDIYRGEFTMLFAERIQEKMVNTLEDLLTGLTYADQGTIHVLGCIVKPGNNYMTVPQMMGYCHFSSFLLSDLTVQEHFKLFTNICLWHESRAYITEYEKIRYMQLIAECDLESVRHEQIQDLDVYYHAQLCWAIAMLLEPRLVLIPNLTTHDTRYIRVIRDKIMQYRKYVTLIKMCFSSIQLEYADRVFLFDTKILAFGGTPAYMFFKYGREYRVRLTLRSESTLDDNSTADFLSRASQAGATVRAHLGTLLILRVPATPTDAVAALVKDAMENADKYGLMGLHISVPDSEEVYRRAIKDIRAATSTLSTHQVSNDALKRIAEPVTWRRKVTYFINLRHMRHIGWKYYSFYNHYRLFFIYTITSALAAGIFIGLSLSRMLARSDRDEAAKKLLHGEVLTMEFLEEKTTLVLRSDNASQSRSLANAYVLSEPNATRKEVEQIEYTALPHTESLIEYLVTRAIDSPQLYVYMYAYGMDVSTSKNGALIVQALYSPLHFDYGAAARSMAKVYTAILRHYTGHFNASIQVTDEPLALDLTPWLKYAKQPPLLIQFILILSICHMTFIPSMEHGLIRHMQSHAMNFSPARYWLTLYVCDFVLYWLLVGFMSAVMMLIMYLVAPANHFQYQDLLAVPFMLIIYGIACIPQAYLFSLGRRVALNSMTFVIVSIVVGETTIVAKLLYEDFFIHTLLFMNISPQFNMAYAFVKIKQIFLYNSECVIFKTQKLCKANTLHKCCKKCGVLQKCFFRKSYLSRESGVLYEAIVLVTMAAIFMIILLLLEYKVIHRFCKQVISCLVTLETPVVDNLMPGAEKEKKNVLDKCEQMKLKHREIVNTFGEYLLAQNLTNKMSGEYTAHDIYLGLGKGEALALSGLKRHGRLKLCEMLAGYVTPSHGHAWSMCKWKQETNPHLYARQISLSCEKPSLPPWMAAREALEMIALLRGVPKKHVHDEVRNLLEALELQSLAETLISRIIKRDQTRLHFAAAVVGAPPVVVLDEYTAYQQYSVRRAMYSILYHLRKNGHAVLVSSAGVESHLPVTNRLAFIVDGTIKDIDTVDNLVARYSNKGYTVVLHLKSEVNVMWMFARHFKTFVVNDRSEVLVNVQVLDTDLNWASIFERMEELKSLDQRVLSYVVTAIPIDYIYNSIITNEKGNKAAKSFILFKKKNKKPKIRPSQEKFDALIPFEKKYNITKLKELPWSVIFTDRSTIS